MHNVALAVLCGGESRRLGTDKGLYAPLGDESLAARTVRLFAEHVAIILLVVHSGEQADLYRRCLPEQCGDGWAKVQLVVDDHSELAYGLPRAALAGIYSALKAATEYPEVVTIPVDQLGVRPLHLQQLMRAAQAHPEAQAVAFSEEDGDPVPFPSLWRPSAKTILAARLGSGACRVRAALQDSLTHLIPADPSDSYLSEFAQNGNTKADLEAYFGSPLFDPHHRRLHYLRFSLTEACNMACTYCLPDGFPEWYRHKARLTTAQIATFLGGFRQLGFRKVRFTGGEPTVHPGCLAAVRTARQLGYEKIALTSNGLLLGDLERWRSAGLTHLNLSLDSVVPEVFQKITKSDRLDRVLEAIEQATALGLEVKINTVLMRSVNGSPEQINALIDWALQRRVTLRFIELMSTKLNDGFATDARVLGSEIAPLLLQRGLAPLSQPGRAPDLRGPAVDYGSTGHFGKIGLINPMSCNFCSKCNRLRITAKGCLKLCLFGDHDVPLDQSSPAAVALNVRQLIGTKPERHYLDEGNFGNVATFRTIGG